MSKLKIAPELWDLIYPVGSEFKTDDSTFDPNNKFNGTWTKYYQGKDYIPLGSALLYTGQWFYESGPYGPVTVRESYSKELISGCFRNDDVGNTDYGIATANSIPTPPTGYKLQIQFSAAMATGGANNVRVLLNGLNILKNTSWGAEEFLPTVKSRFFDLDEITIAPLNNYGGHYSGRGLCLRFQNAVDNNWCKISELMGHGYFTSLNDVYKWKRVS